MGQTDHGYIRFLILQVTIRRLRFNSGRATRERPMPAPASSGLTRRDTDDRHSGLDSGDEDLKGHLNGDLSHDLSQLTARVDKMDSSIATTPVHAQQQQAHLQHHHSAHAHHMVGLDFPGDVESKSCVPTPHELLGSCSAVETSVLCTPVSTIVKGEPPQ
uniref:Uncharacterized protein n=1 Tax=Branchiostoma floridae TaxID=7739 RepID=C3ZQB9_BRAFL|eukprot:XP_002589164.1 hypothetical protein BRAFLDRAFT_84942 [Branchiostoma floridae]